MPTFPPQTITGAYRVQYGSVAGYYGQVYDLGEVQDGITIRMVRSYETVTADSGGDSTLNLINRGGDTFVDFVGLEYDQMLDIVNAGNNRQLFFPELQDNDIGFPVNLVDQVGEHLWDFADTLLLTPLPQGGNATRIYQFNRAIIVSDLDIVLGTSFVRVPVTFQCFPDGTDSDDTLGVSV